jgi:hypothetical protein
VASLWLYRFHCLENGGRLEHHSCTAAIWVVIDNTMPVMSIVSNVMNHNVDQIAVAGSFYNALAERALEHVREQGQNVNAHVKLPPDTLLA